MGWNPLSVPIISPIDDTNDCSNPRDGDDNKAVVGGGGDCGGGCGCGRGGCCFDDSLFMLILWTSISVLEYLSVSLWR